ncbi:hypothetical protein [uncultured Thiodictyon sp.]|uniref:hypothetical protein n=1 Tax=uncultured Thiodictyon sp. TaxID=1846217 RepID=UPI0025F4917B|nr:hypothetical protein [uncultured Thiodictyon sp.]
MKPQQPPRDGPNNPQPSERGKTWGLVPRRYTANQRALARVYLPQLLADLAATADACPGRLGVGPTAPLVTNPLTADAVPTARPETAK